MLNSLSEKTKFETILAFNRGEKMIEPVIIKKPKNISSELSGPILSIF